MATLTYREPTIIGSGNIREPRIFLVNPAQNAAWRRGDILVQSTTGTITVPPGNGNGALAGIAGPVASAVTITNSAVANAPAATYFIQVSYTAAGPIESQPSVMFVQNCPPGFMPSISVASAGAPGAATNFAAYVGLIPGYLSLQQATKVTTALGAAFVCANPLANSQGANRGATNLAGSILGIAQEMSNSIFFDGVGGSFLAGTPGSRLGSTNTYAPMTPNEAMLSYVVGLGAGQLVEMNLNANVGAWSPYLIGTQVGLTLDATTGFFTADSTQANKVAVIVDQRPGVYIGPTAQGSAGDIGARVVVEFLAAALALS